MRFLQIVSGGTRPSGPPDPAHLAKIRASIARQIEDGTLLAAGALGKRAIAGARVIRRGDEVRVEDPPTGEGWMAGGGYSLTEFASKEEAIAAAKASLDVMGDGVLELIQVSEAHPAPGVKPGAERAAASPELAAGVVPYLSFDGASEAARFYQRAFGAREVGRMAAEDGKRLMHCHLEINGGAFMLSDNFPELGLGPVQRSVSYIMQLIVADGDMWWKRAIDAGCKERVPFAVAPWGDKYGQLTDPFGVTWAINSPAQR